MPTNPMSVEMAQEALDAFERCGRLDSAASFLGIPRTTLQHRLLVARERYGLEPNQVARKKPTGDIDVGRIRAMLQSSPTSLHDLANALKVTEGRALDACLDLRRDGLNVYEHDGLWSIEKTPVPVAHDDDLHTFVSDSEGGYRFGFVTDNHLGSKYAREDTLNDLYDWFAAEGVTRVYNAGNWIDGESHFNKFDLLIHGMSAQVRYFCEKYPQRKGITTYYVAGDDHEGWYAQRHGVDIGRYAQEVAQDEYGRHDLKYLGYIESFIVLKRLGTDATARMLVMHPGGGSAYATSYAPQKIVESFEGGEKPAVLLLGHYHKLEAHNDRNVWVSQGGCTQDQTPFMRKKKLQAHVGGQLIEMRQDERGSITEFIPRMRRYFDRSYHNGSFNPAGPVKRVAA